MKMPKLRFDLIALIAALIASGGGLHTADARLIEPFVPAPAIVDYHPEDIIHYAEIQTETASHKKLILKDWRRSISLDGEWRISELKNDAADFSRELDDKTDYLQAEFDDSGWDTIAVPLDFFRKYPKLRTKEKPFVKGCYRRVFELSADDLKERSVTIHFGVIGYEGILFVNGKRMGSHIGTFTPWDVDITEVLRPGKNVLALQVFTDFGNRWGTNRPDRVSQGAQYSIGGIKGGLWQSVSLEVSARPVVRQMLVTPLYSEKKIRVDYIIDNLGAAVTVVPGLTVSSASKKDNAEVVNAKDFPQISLNPGKNTGSLVLDVPKIKSWDLESPNLNHVTLYLQKHGEVVSAEAERFGFREFKAEGDTFLLNGKRIFLFGDQFHSHHYDGLGRSVQEDRDRLIKELKQFRSLGYNTLRTAMAPMSPTVYELADEMGMMMYDSWSWANANDLDEKLFPVYTEQGIKEWVMRDYNHPSVVMWTCGNEVSMRKPFIQQMLNRCVPLVRSLDKSGRPVSAFSGSGDWGYAGRGKVETDVIDNHNYLGMGNFHWTHWDHFFNNFYSTTLEDYAKPGDTRLKMPYVMWESVGYSWGAHTDKKFRPDDIEDYAKYVNTPYTWANPTAIGFAGVMSLKTAVQGQVALKSARELYGKRLLEMIRQDDRIQGLAPWFTDSSISIATLWNQRLLCGLRTEHTMPPRSFLVGTPREMEFYWINSSSDEWKKATTSIEFIDASGKNYPLQTVEDAEIGIFQKKAAKIMLNLPACQDGWGQLRLVMAVDGKEISRNFYDVFVMSRSVMTDKITSHYKAGLWRSGGNAGQPLPVEAILKQLGVDYTIISTADQVKGIQALIVPPNAKLEPKDHTALLQYIDQGGRVLVLEQDWGLMPCIENYTVTKSPAPFVDLAISTHPIFRNLNQDNFDLWANPDYGNIVSNVINPFSLNALAVKGPIYGQALIGSAVIEGTHGKGRLIGSQLEAVKMWGVDASATVYLRNLLSYLLDGSKDYEAKPLDLMDERNLKVDQDRVVKFDLRPYANRGFKDDKADDYQGGWTDQGNNDFRYMPLGAQTLLNVPFEIIDPAKNNDKSALILAGATRPRFPKQIQGIQVNGKFSRLYFLQTSAWTRGETLGHYKVNYADGTSYIQELIGNRNIGDWCDCHDLPYAKLALVHCNKEVAVAEGFNLASRIGLWNMEWRNPFPEKEIKTIDFVSNGKSILILVAMSGEKFNPERLTIFKGGRASKIHGGAWQDGDPTTITKVQNASNPAYPESIKVDMPAKKGKGIATAAFWFDSAKLPNAKYKYLTLVLRCPGGKGAVDVVLPNKDWSKTLAKTLVFHDRNSEWEEIRIPLEEMGLGRNGFSLDDLRGELFLYNGVKHSMEMPVSLEIYEMVLE